jgi:hypothetical protein
LLVVHLDPFILESVAPLRGEGALLRGFVIPFGPLRLSNCVETSICVEISMRDSPLCNVKIPLSCRVVGVESL